METSPKGHEIKVFGQGRGINACEEQHIVDQGWFSQIIACGTEWDSVHVRQSGLSACETKMFVKRA